MTLYIAEDTDRDIDDADFYDPRGALPERSFSAAGRVGRLSGVSVALLSNRKRNADRLLEHVGRLLRDEHDVAATIVDAKEAMSLPAPEAQLRALAGKAEAIVVAVGDCGSCSATSVMDAIAAEALGVPSVPIVTEQFRSGAEMVASMQGAADFPIAWVEHPIATLDDAELEERAEAAVASIVEILTTGRAAR